MKVLSENGRYSAGIVAGNDVSDNTVGIRVTIYDTVKDVESTFLSDTDTVRFGFGTGELSTAWPKTPSLDGICWVGKKEY